VNRGVEEHREIYRAATVRTCEHAPCTVG